MCGVQPLRGVQAPHLEPETNSVFVLPPRALALTLRTKPDHITCNIARCEVWWWANRSSSLNTISHSAQCEKRISHCDRKKMNLKWRESTHNV